MEKNGYDTIIVGSGIIGLAFAYTLMHKGQRVLVLEQHGQPVSASVRNFGLVTVSGQPYCEPWEMAKRGSELWREVLPRLNMAPVQEGCLLTARSAIGQQLLEEYRSTEPGRECTLLTEQGLRDRFPYLADGIKGALFSPHELRLDSGGVVMGLISYLKERGVTFMFNCRVHEVSTGQVHCSAGRLSADRVVVASGTDTRFLFPELWKAHSIKLCKLQMQRVRPAVPFLLPHSVMADYSYHFYAGFQQMPSAAALSEWFRQNHPELYRHQMHLIAVQHSDGDLIIGDSHEYLDEIDPFEQEEIYALQMEALEGILGQRHYRTIQRWLGYYPWSLESQTIVEEVGRDVTAVLVNRGKGMTISFALAEKTVEQGFAA